jgi:hypothetical protein
MTNSSYTVTGTIMDGNTVKLDESPPIRSTKVRATIEPLDIPHPNRYGEVMAEIRRNQKARKHQPPTPAEVEEYLYQERDSWE